MTEPINLAVQRVIDDALAQGKSTPYLKAMGTDLLAKLADRNPALDRENVIFNILAWDWGLKSHQAAGMAQMIEVALRREETR